VSAVKQRRCTASTKDRQVRWPKNEGNENK